ncbi:hypothetical protein BANRA_05118 [Escherichia coli]|nr:hypothetical protein BANRA_05118 [Escherichia coli]
MSLKLPDKGQWAFIGLVMSCDVLYWLSCCLLPERKNAALYMEEF